jgi:NTE family protein
MSKRGGAWRWLLAALLGGAMLAAQAQEPAAPAQEPAAARAAPKPPRIGLVLSGGGARGFAHIGVLRVLQRLNVPVHVVVGASMGAVIGGAYAAGRPVDELADFVTDTDWASILADRPPRSDLSFRRRADDLAVPSRLEIGLGAQGVVLPPAAAGNQALEATLWRLLPPGAGERPAARLALPFRAVATDLRSGELVELGQSPLFVSLRASLAVPGLFAPLRVEHRLLVDGGLVRNLPVDIARALGAEVVIAVNVGTPLSDESTLNSAFGVAQQMINILTEQNVQRSLAQLGPRDVLVQPQLEALSFLDFGAARQAMAAGELAALQMESALRALAVPAEDYAAAEAARTGGAVAAAPARQLPFLGFEMQAAPDAGAATLAAEAGIEFGQRLTLSQARRAADRLYGRGDFERVEVEERADPAQPDGRGLVLTPVESDWRRSRLRLGLELSSDFNDDNRFTVSALHVLPWLNPWGGELRTLARLGSVRTLGTEWWQPLGPGSRWFGMAALQHDSQSLDNYTERLRTLRIGVSTTSATLALGRLLGDAGIVQAGLSRRVFRGTVLLPETAGFGTLRNAVTTRFLEVDIDTLEPLAFPTRGVLLQARYDNAPGDSNDARTLAQSSVATLLPFRLGTWGGHLYGEWAKGRDGYSPLQLGGFLRLSGTPRNSIDGTTVLLARAVFGRQVGQMPPGLGGAVRVGMSLEAGGGFADIRRIRGSEVREAASLFVSVDTRLGPLYLAAGGTRGGLGTVYLFLGPFW